MDISKRIICFFIHSTLIVMSILLLGGIYPTVAKTCKQYYVVENVNGVNIRKNITSKSAKTDQYGKGDKVYGISEKNGWIETPKEWVYDKYLNKLDSSEITPNTDVKGTVSMILPIYRGDRPEFSERLEKAFETKYPHIDLKMKRIDWNVYVSTRTAAINSGEIPDLVISHAKDILKFSKTGILAPINKSVSQAFINNFDPSLPVKMNNNIYALPLAMGTRFMYYRSDLIEEPPETFEEMLAIAQKIHNPPELYAIGKFFQGPITFPEFIYYLLGNGGKFFERNSDGSLGKCLLNSKEAVEALTFLHDLTSKYKVTTPSSLTPTRQLLGNMFVAGKVGFLLSGGQTAAILSKEKVPFKWAVAPMPYFKGKKRKALNQIDFLVMFNSKKNHQATGKFLEFFYKDQWQAEFQSNIGFIPVTKSLAQHPAFQDPVRKVMIQSIPSSGLWPPVQYDLEAHMWEALETVFHGYASPKEALDKLTAKVDALEN